jgi:hypothetical protein
MRPSSLEQIKMPTKRQTRRARNRRRNNRGGLFIAGIALVLVATAGFLAWRNSQASPTPTTSATGTPAPVGESIPVIPDRSHVAEGTDPGPYNSDPPTSGRHYDTPAAAGFYDSDPYPSHPEGHLVHSLEHGYVIFWYNCKPLSVADCSTLKTQIKDAMNAGGNSKLIAFPWPSIDVPVVMTSWGRLLKLETFDPQEAAAFIRANRNQAPEPDAP